MLFWGQKCKSPITRMGPPVFRLVAHGGPHRFTTLPGEAGWWSLAARS
jgi:hypothetical protein